MNTKQLRSRSMVCVSFLTIFCSVLLSSQSSWADNVHYEVIGSPSFTDFIRTNTTGSGQALLTNLDQELAFRSSSSILRLSMEAQTQNQNHELLFCTGLGMFGGTRQKLRQLGNGVQYGSFIRCLFDIFEGTYLPFLQIDNEGAYQLVEQ